MNNYKKNIYKYIFFTLTKHYNRIKLTKLYVYYCCYFEKYIIIENFIFDILKNSLLLIKNSIDNKIYLIIVGIEKIYFY